LSDHSSDCEYSPKELKKKKQLRREENENFKKRLNENGGIETNPDFGPRAEQIGNDIEDGKEQEAEQDERQKYKSQKAQMKLEEKTR